MRSLPLLAALAISASATLPAAELPLGRYESGNVRPRGTADVAPGQYEMGSRWTPGSGNVGPVRDGVTRNVPSRFLLPREFTMTQKVIGTGSGTRLQPIPGLRGSRLTNSPLRTQKLRAYKHR
jgi:hypothetical protein